MKTWHDSYELWARKRSRGKNIRSWLWIVKRVFDISRQLTWSKKEKLPRNLKQKVYICAYIMARGQVWINATFTTYFFPGVQFQHETTELRPWTLASSDGWSYRFSPDGSRKIWWSWAWRGEYQKPLFSVIKSWRYWKLACWRTLESTWVSNHARCSQYSAEKASGSCHKSFPSELQEK